MEDFCNRIHKGILRHFKYALVWGVSVKHRPQKVGASHMLEDEVRPLPARLPSTPGAVRRRRPYFTLSQSVLG